MKSLLQVIVVLALPGLLTPVAVAQRLGSEFQVNSYTADKQAYGAVAAGASGDFVVAWQSEGGQDGSSLGIFARRFTSAGVGLASEFQVNSYTTGNQYDANVAVGASGDFVVTWVSNPIAAGGHVFARLFSSAGAAVASEFQVDAALVGSSPRAAPLASGEFVIAWRGLVGDGLYFDVFARRFSTAGVALANEFQVNTHTVFSQIDPSVATGASGDFVVTWSSDGQDGAGLGIFAQRFSSAGAALASEFQVNSHTEVGERNSVVAAAASGDFVVAWLSNGQDGSDDGIFLQRFSSAGVALASELQVNTSTLGDQSFPSVAAGAGGNFVVTWESAEQDGDGYAIFARNFSSTGAPVASEFQVNTYTPNGQFYPRVAAAASGNFVVAWSSYLQDGSAAGVFAQRFASPKKLDIDGDGAILALTDGLLVLRSTFTFTGQVLISGAVNLAGCTRCDAATIEAYLETLN